MYYPAKTHLKIQSFPGIDNAYKLSKKFLKNDMYRLEGEREERPDTSRIAKSESLGSHEQWNCRRSKYVMLFMEKLG